MKKLTVITLAVFMSLTLMLTSCDISLPFLNGEETTAAATEETAETTTAAEEATTTAPEDTETNAPAGDNTDTNAPSGDDTNTSAPADSLIEGGADTEGGWGPIITPSR